MIFSSSLRALAKQSTLRRMDCRVAALLATTLLCAGNAQSKSADTDFEMAEAFAKCTALYDSVGDYAEKNKEVDLAENYHGLARGAKITSMFFSADHAGTKTHEFTDNIIETNRPIFNASLTHEGVSGIKKDLEECTKLNPIQTKIIKNMRKQTYGFSEK